MASRHLSQYPLALGSLAARPSCDEWSVPSNICKLPRSVIGSNDTITSHYGPVAIGSNDAITTEVIGSNRAITTKVIGSNKAITTEVLRSNERSNNEVMTEVMGSNERSNGAVFRINGLY